MVLAADLDEEGIEVDVEESGGHTGAYTRRMAVALKAMMTLSPGCRRHFVGRRGGHRGDQRPAHIEVNQGNRPQPLQPNHHSLLVIAGRVRVRSQAQHDVFRPDHGMRRPLALGHDIEAEIFCPETVRERALPVPRRRSAGRFLQ